MKKYIALFIILITVVFWTSTLSAFASTQKNLILSKNLLENTKNGEEYISELSKIFKILQWNPVSLGNFQKKIIKMKVSLESKKSLNSKEKNTKLIVDYIYYSLLILEEKNNERENNLFWTRDEILTYFSKISLDEFEKLLYELSLEELQKVSSKLLMDNTQFKDLILESYIREKKKTHDYTRIVDITVLRNWIEMIYSDYGEYPSTKSKLKELLQIYVLSLPVDSLSKIIKNNCHFWYKYEVWDDKSWVKNQVYKISTCFESEEAVKNYAEQDWGVDKKRYELWYPSSDWNNWKSFFLDWEQDEWKEVDNEENTNEAVTYDSLLQEDKRDFLIFSIASQNPKVIKELEVNARNIKRSADIMQIQSAIEMYFTKNFKYPKASEIGIFLKESLWEIPKDSLEWKLINWCSFGYFYEVWDTKSILGNIIEQQEYRLSSCSEEKDSIIVWIFDNLNNHLGSKVLIK